jgi:antitoxin component YwqK of YwqJK toxin-antitoxin module
VKDIKIRNSVKMDGQMDGLMWRLIKDSPYFVTGNNPLFKGKSDAEKETIDLWFQS